jgi:hypothetical protein
MMKLEENRSQIWMKVLSPAGGPIDDSQEDWMLPQGIKKSSVMDFSNSPAVCYKDNQWEKLSGVFGTWLVNNPTIVYPLNSGRRIFIAELLSLPGEESPGIIWVTRLRLVREATNMDLKAFGIFRSFSHFV